MGPVAQPIRVADQSGQLDTARQSRACLKFGSYTIKPYGYVTIHTGKGTGTQTDRYWNRSWYVWNNTGDTAILKNQNGAVIDQCSYKGTSQGYTYC